MNIEPVTLQTVLIDHIKTGARVRNARLRAGVSLRELARRLNLSAPFVSDLERGRRNWTTTLLGKVNKAL